MAGFTARVALMGVASLTLCAVIGAQGDSTAASAAAPTYTLRTNVRAVVTDVLVLDKDGRPVEGLPASAFHLSDDGKPVSVASFEEHRGAPQASAEESLPADTYSNSNLLQRPPVSNILVIDIANLVLTDQMYLSYQLDKFIANLPSGTPLAIYFSAGIQSVLLQDFTADHARLLTAVHRSLPHFPAMGRAYYTDGATLHQIAQDFASVPGRKNVLWFSGGSRLSLTPAGMVTMPNMDMRGIYDELESARIAIYPIDARGILTARASGPAPRLATLRSDLGFDANDYVNTSDAEREQHGLMHDVAAATGGLPFYNTNGLWQAAMHAVDTGHDFYTLSYTPQHLKFDNQWHKVKVEVDGEHYRLSYRRGYFADGTHVDAPDGSRTYLLAGSKTQTVDTAAEAQPIIFRVEVKPVPSGSLLPGESPPARGQTRYAIHFVLPGNAFARKAEGKESDVVVGVGFMALDRNGKPLLQHAKQVTFAVHEIPGHPDPGATIPIEQRLDLNKGDTYLSLLVWDAVTHRVGSLSVPLQVP